MFRLLPMLADTDRFFRYSSILIDNPFATWRNRTLDLCVASCVPYLLDHRACVCESAANIPGVEALAPLCQGKKPTAKPRNNKSNTGRKLLF